MRSNLKLILISYVMIIASAVTYYSLIDSNDPMSRIFLLLITLFIITLSISNYKLFELTNTDLVNYDILFISWVMLIPKISLDYGLSRLIMAIGAFIYAIYMTKTKSTIIPNTLN
ncbi:hypothetical protein [uncultured Anaerococcus sp.]|uniref:hypothetical protein n=1 Tax=uncultured Anaerococcus sp. TaxID=293428 RepID=UPI00262FEE9E|nr:hypothetical protein [uncultured Anaerococcus sp.]